MLRHVPGGPLAADHDAEDVDAHHPVEVGEVVVEEAASSAEPTPALLNMTWSPPNRSTAKSTSAWTWSASATSVRWNAAASPSVGGQLLAPLGVDVGDDDLSALGHEPLGGRAARCRGAPGDDRDLAVELAGHVRTPAAQFGRVVTNWHLICRP